MDKVGKDGGVLGKRVHGGGCGGRRGNKETLAGLAMIRWRGKIVAASCVVPD